MMASRRKARTTGSADFDPDALFDSWSTTKTLPEDHDLRSSIIASFNLPSNDHYVYHAIASVTLDDVQQAIAGGSQHGLHAWYVDDDGETLPPPPQVDVLAYTAVFSSTTSTPKALTALAANAKKGSHRADIASYLQTSRLLSSADEIRKVKRAHVNPYYDYWCWACQELEWAGPDPRTINVRTSHHILPIFMHHFGCVVPSYESLEVIRRTARGRNTVEVGSGNGYWTFMLRRMGLPVTAVDNLQSEYRTLWISDTVVQDGVNYLKAEKGAKDALLLLVYPIIGLDFTSKILEAYKGDTICVAGTQNKNGYTAFQDRTVDEYIAREKKQYKKAVQIPLPSFPGKDEALFVFERKSDATD